MTSKRHSALSLTGLDTHLHELLHLQWCHDHPVACTLLTLAAIAGIGMLVVTFRPTNGSRYPVGGKAL